MSAARCPCIGGERRRAGERIPGPGVVDPCRPLVFLREMSEAITLPQHHPCLVVQSSPISRARGIIGSSCPDYDTVSVQNRGTFPSRGSQGGRVSADGAVSINATLYGPESNASSVISLPLELCDSRDVSRGAMVQGRKQGAVTGVGEDRSDSHDKTALRDEEDGWHEEDRKKWEPNP